jgi:hypothetical protein
MRPNTKVTIYSTPNQQPLEVRAGAAGSVWIVARKPDGDNETKVIVADLLAAIAFVTDGEALDDVG